MKINVRNYSDLERLEFPIVVLKGDIECEDAVTEFGILLDDIPCHKSLAVIHNTFSAILRLNPGRNCILFKSCNEVVGRIELIFERRGSHYFQVKPLIVSSKSQISSSDDSKSVESLYFNKIKVCLELIQWYFSEKLFEAGFPRSSFNLTSCSHFRLPVLPSEIQEMTVNKLWETLGREIREDKDLWNERWKYVAFIIHPWNEEMSNKNGLYAFEPQSALGGGGLVLLNHTFLRFWPESWEIIFHTLNDNSEIPEFRSLSPLTSSTGRQFGASLGIVAHEIGHVFDLGHAENGLLGRDFHRFALTFQPKLKSALGVKTNKVYSNSGNVLEDPVQLTPSSLALLHYNRWFRSSVPPVSDVKLSVLKCWINSGFGITVVEVRNPETGLVLSSWITERHQLKTKFLLSKQFVEEKYGNQNVELVIQDASGSVLKTSFNFLHAPKGVTSIKRRINRLML